MGATQSELTLARLVDEREVVRGKHESKLAEINTRDDKTITGDDKETLTAYRERAAELDVEIADLTQSLEAANRAVEESKAIRRAMAGGGGEGVDVSEDGVSYRTMASYARDVILTGQGRIAGSIAQRVRPEEVQAAKERLELAKRTPANTLSSNI